MSLVERGLGKARKVPVLGSLVDRVVASQPDRDPSESLLALNNFRETVDSLLEQHGSRFRQLVLCNGNCFLAEWRLNMRTIRPDTDQKLEGSWFALERDPRRGSVVWVPNNPHPPLEWDYGISGLVNDTVVIGSKGSGYATTTAIEQNPIEPGDPARVTHDIASLSKDFDDWRAEFLNGMWEVRLLEGGDESSLENERQRLETEPGRKEAINGLREHLQELFVRTDTIARAQALIKDFKTDPSGRPPNWDQYGAVPRISLTGRDMFGKEIEVACIPENLRRWQGVFKDNLLIMLGAILPEISQYVIVGPKGQNRCELWTGELLDENKVRFTGVMPLEKEEVERLRRFLASSSPVEGGIQFAAGFNQLNPNYIRWVVRAPEVVDPTSKVA